MYPLLEKLTISIEGHGSPDGNMHLIGGYHTAMEGDAETWSYITPHDLADALNKRWQFLQGQIAVGKITKEEAREPIIIAYMSCFGSNQIRLLYENLDPGMPEVYCIAGSEYGQVMYGFDSPFSSTHTEGSVLQIDRGGPATMGGAIKETMKKESLYRKSNPVIILLYDPQKLDVPEDRIHKGDLHLIPIQISMGEASDDAEKAV